MGRKRKNLLKKLNTNNLLPNKTTTCANNLKHASDINKIIGLIQKDVTSQQHFIREIRRIYTEMDHHDEFMKIIISILMFIMQQPEEDSNANTVLRFLCTFLASYKDDENENPCRSIFSFVLSTDGANPHIRFRLCELVNTLLFSLGDATLDEEICDQILSYMLNRLNNSSPHIRAQAIYALERLQMPEDPDDIVIKHFIYHMQSDPAAKVREAVISKIARNTTTIPIIIERLQDAEQRVRRHTYIEMMKGLSVKSYRVAQRITFLESGLTDESLSIRKIVAHLMITEWLVSYNDNPISFLRALKLNGSDEELQRYHNTAKYVLRQIFKKTKLDKLLASACNEIKSAENDEQNEEDSEPTTTQLCIPIEHLTLEYSVFWVNLAEYVYEEKSNDIDSLLPDLTTYCEYVTSYYNFTSNTDADIPIREWEELEHGYILTNLVNNLKYFDYSDDVGKNNLKDFICRTLKNCNLNDHSIKTLLTIMETIIPDTNDRLSMLQHVILDLYTPDYFEFVNDRPLMQSILQNSSNSNILLTISDLKVNIMDLKEQIANFLTENDYESAEKTTEELNDFEVEYNKALMPLLTLLPEKEANSILQAIEKAPSSNILKCIRITFFMLSSKGVSTLTPVIRPLYNKLIRRFTESNQMNLRRWALKCGTTFALLHEQFSQDMFMLLRKQFIVKPSTPIWKVSIRGIFQLLALYNMKLFDDPDRNMRFQTSTSMYSNNEFSQDGVDIDVEASPNVNILSFMLHLLDTCNDEVIFNSVIEGFCLLCLTKPDMYPQVILKLMITYFDPATESKANQLLGAFFKKLIVIGKSIVLEPALLPTINKILGAGCESTMGKVNPKTVIRFVINAANSKYAPGELNIREIIAESFLREIHENLNKKFQLVKVLSFELIRLHRYITNEKKIYFMKTIDDIFIDFRGADKIKQNLINFQTLLSGELTPRSANISTSYTANSLTEESEDDKDETDSNDQVNVDDQVETLSNKLLESRVPKIPNPKRRSVEKNLNLRKSSNRVASPNMDSNSPIYELRDSDIIPESPTTSRTRIRHREKHI